MTTTLATNPQWRKTRAERNRRQEQTNRRVNDLLDGFYRNGAVADLGGALLRRGLIDATGHLTDAGRRTAIGLIVDNGLQSGGPSKTADEVSMEHRKTQSTWEASQRQLARLRARQ